MLLKISNTSAGVNSVGAVPSCPCSPFVPYKRFLIVVNLAESTFVESITNVAVGLNPSTSIGVVEISQLNVIASGLSLIVA